MRESIGNGLLLNIVVVFSTLIILLFVSIISYSKAYRVKNKIIDVIEQYGGYETCSEGECASKEIEESLKKAGYSTISKDFCTDPNGRVQRHLRDMGLAADSGGYIANKNNNVNGYNYCVFEVTDKTTTLNGVTPKYYVVVTFVHFDFPIIGNMINMPVYGETKIFGKNYDY